MLVVMVLTVLGGAVLLARRNLRLGRGDRQGAFKLALFTFSVMALGSLIGAHHVPVLFGELLVFYKAISFALFIAVILWLLYIALEPYLRRHWPQLLILWSRLLSGEFRDPMVGRDVLAAGVLGLGHTLAIYGSVLTLQMFDVSEGPRVPTSTATLGGLGDVLEDFLSGIGLSICVGLATMCFLLLLYIFLRRRWAAAGVMWLIIATVEILFFASTWASAVFNMAIATLMVITVCRFGLLTAIVWQFVFYLSLSYPLTTDLSIWYANRSIFALSVLVALSSYGAYISLGGQRMFHNKLLED
jgi:serine/threonine-protein kinase